VKKVIIFFRAEIEVFMPDSPEDKKPFVTIIANEEGEVGKTTTLALVDELLDYIQNLRVA
jgi:hypothetical protein